MRTIPTLGAAIAVCLASGALCPARAASGASLYATNCAACHLANAAGVPGQYPKLAGRIDKIASTPAGKAYLADVLVHGMVGHIEADGQDYVGYMPAFKRLSDTDIAAILTWLSALGGKPAPAIEAAEIGPARGNALSASQVAALRHALVARHKLP